MKVPRFNICKFDLIDSFEKAYWLGFILGDGNLRKTSLRIELNEKDKNHLEKLNNFLDGQYVPKKRQKDCFGIDFCSVEFCKKLIKYIPENKTYSMKTHPKIDTSLLSHYYRGLLDSDGWVVEHKLKTTTQYEFGLCNYNIEFLEPIQNWASQHIGKQVGSIRSRKFNSSNGSVAQLIIGGNKNFIKLYDLLYQNSTEFCRLDRKYEKATNFYNEINNRVDKRFKEVLLDVS